ncbi:MAG: hypothetical protein ABIK66_06305, partial [candidate division WOR-3 bacterium]
YPQAVVADFPVLSPTEGQVLVGLEKRPDRLQVPGQLTLVITSYPLCTNRFKYSENKCWFRNKSSIS